MRQPCIIALASLLATWSCASASRDVVRRATETPNWQAGYLPSAGATMSRALAQLEARLVGAGLTITPFEICAAERSLAAVLGYANGPRLRICLDRTLPIDAQFEVLAHEAGHFFFLGGDDDLAARQVFAELVAVEVCAFHGHDIRALAARYLARYKHAFGAMRYMRVDFRYAVDALTGRAPMPTFTSRSAP